jgi:hypothetical protein
MSAIKKTRQIHLYIDKCSEHPMMSFMDFLEININTGIGDIRDIEDTRERGWMGK